MFAFWNQESRLAPDTLGRLTQLLAVLYSTNTERQFLYHSTNLLLELTSRSPDFSRSIFDSPLSECKFEVRILVYSYHNATVVHVHVCVSVMRLSAVVLHNMVTLCNSHLPTLSNSTVHYNESPY